MLSHTARHPQRIPIDLVVRVHMMDEYLTHRPSPGKYCQVPDPAVRMKRRTGTEGEDARRAGGGIGNRDQI